MFAGCDALCATLLIGVVGGAGGDALRATLLLEVSEVLEVLEMPEVMRCALSVCWRLWRVGFVCRR